MRDAVVIGGGLIGCSIAFELASRGLKVAVVERDLPGRAASFAGAGMLSPIGETSETPEFIALARASLAAYPAFIERVTQSSGATIEFVTTGKIEVRFAYDGDDRRHVLPTLAGVRPLSPVEALRIEPALNPDITSAIQFPEDGLVDNRMLNAALWQAARTNGVEFLLGRSVNALRSSQGRVTGVHLTSGDTILTEKAVLAAGAWSALFAGLPRVLPVVPVRGQMCAIHLVPRPLDTILQSERCYLIPRSAGRVLVGATVERVGFDPRVTSQGMHDLLAAAMEVVPALRDAEVQETWAGFRPGTPDDLPIVGADPDLAGLYYATGHFRNGILLTPITGALVADLVMDRPPAFALDAFRPDRFAHE